MRRYRSITQYFTNKRLGTILNVGLLLLLLGLTTACGIQIKENALYDGVEVEPVPPRPEKMTLAVEPEIFADDGSYFWTPQDDGDCTEGMVTTEVAHSGSTALQIEWNRDPENCEWAGFGIGWDNWAGKDLTDVYDHAAIEMYVRTKEGKMFGLPVVLTLEDYSGHYAWAYTGAKFFERYYIDEEWQKITVPLTAFDLEEDGIDIGNVKQLMFELQQGGSIYLDDIRLVWYTPEPVTPWYDDAPKPKPMSFPIQLFGDDFINNNGWGIHTDHCQSIELTTATSSEGSKAIHATWDDSKEDCYMVALGVSWNNWFRTDLSEAMENTFLEIDVKNDDINSLNELSVKIGFEDYERRLSLVPLDDQFLDNGSFIKGQWQTLRIPLSAIDGDADYTILKQMVVQMEKAGEIYLDNIRLVRTES